MHPFHLAFPVSDLTTTRAFYEHILGCDVGRSTSRWMDFDFFGHQLSAHLSELERGAVEHTSVDGQAVPLAHFGLVLHWQQWHALAERLRAQGVSFLLEPTIRYPGQVGEQGTFFIVDPSGNAIEFKSIKDPSGLFQTE